MKFYFYYCLIYLIISAFLWQAVPMPEGHYDIDSYGYDSIALHFAQTGIMTDPHHPESAPIQPVGYPFIVGIFYKLFGHDVRSILILQILLMCIALVFIMRIAQHLAGPALGQISGLFFVLCPGFYIYPQLLLAETFLTVLILIICEQFLVFLYTRNFGLLVYAGFCAGMAMLIKPAVMLLICICALLTWCVLKKESKVRICVALFLLSASFALPVSLYIVRNYMRYGHASFAPMMPLNMYQIFLSKIMGRLAHKDPQEIIETELRFKGMHSLDDAGWDPARGLFIKHLKEHPMLCAQIWFKNVCKTWCGLYTTQLKKMIEPNRSLVGHSFFLQEGSHLEKICSYVAGGTTKHWIMLLSWYECIRSLLQLLLALYGLYILFCTNKLYGWFFLGVCISLSLPTGIDGCCRYRIFFEAILLLFSALAFLRIYIHFIIKKGVHVCYLTSKNI